MKEKPRKQTDFILTKPMQWNILICGLTFFIAMFALLIYDEWKFCEDVPVHELTMFFTTFVMMQLWNLFNAKALGTKYSSFHGLWKDKGLLLVLLIVIIGQWLIVTFGGKMFRTVPLSFSDWLIIIVSTSIVLWIGELWRWIKRTHG